MLQVVQHQRTGEILVEELPAPMCLDGGILVQTHFSLISAGTEKTSVSSAQSSLISRARKQPEQVRQVIDIIKKEGLLSTIKKVQSKLDTYKPLGYSAAGVVLESQCDEFVVGDRVACAGAGFAVHSEIISVPKNLAVKLPENVEFEDAAYTTLGAIAMQGVRQADVRLGESIAVIGLGLIGLITVQLLKASGCRVIGLDINSDSFKLAKVFGCDDVLISSQDNINAIIAFSKGLGCDSVLITAGTFSNEPIELALKIARKKGKVVVVGAVGMNIPRSPFYEKELELRISCSYGPGRYDTDYELLGIDYPPAYVRWTENRNMQAFVDLIASGKINVKHLTTHTFDINEAVNAYNLITGKNNQPYIGILLKYPEEEKYLTRKIVHIAENRQISNIKIGFIGAGSFAKSNLLPHIKAAEVELIGVSTETAINAKTAAEQFGFKYSTTDSNSIIADPDINLIFCASRHDTHSHYVVEALKNNKAIFVEKPLAISPEQLSVIDDVIKHSSGSLMVGFNRRFSQAFTEINKFFGSRTEPLIMLYRVNASTLPDGHWVYNELNKGRIIGEVCHFIDCMVYLTKSLPTRVYAECLSAGSRAVKNFDNVIISLNFADSSIGTIIYTSRADKSLPKEYCEVHCEGSTAIMHNFSKLELMCGGRQKKIKLNKTKGHKEEIISFIDSIKSGKLMPISYEELRAVTNTTFIIEESLRVGNAIQI